MLIRNKVHRI